LLSSSSSPAAVMHTTVDASQKTLSMLIIPSKGAHTQIELGKLISWFELAGIHTIAVLRNLNMASTSCFNCVHKG
jgi:hypothetical protein